MDDVTWRALTGAANEAFERGDDLEARLLYGRALAEANALFGRHELIAPALHTITCHNLAELNRRAGDGTTARAYLDEALEKLVEAACDEALPFPFRLRSLENVKHALAELFTHCPDGLTPAVGRAMLAWVSIKATAAEAAATVTQPA